jgi:rfaE bifunctional protein kinase chain/domain
LGHASRLSQEAPVPIVAVDSQRDKLGMAANVADNVKHFGAVPYLVTLVGDDRIGDELCDLLRENEISAEYVYRHKSRRTSLKERIIAQNQQVVRIDHERAEPLNAEAEEYFCAKLPELVAKFDCVLFEDYAKGLLTHKVARTIIELAKKEKKFVSVDPPTMGRPLDAYKEASLIKPNLFEAEKLSGIEITDDASLERAGKFLLKELNTPIVIITRGKLGMTLFTRDSKPIHVPTFARAVYDVSGAGDTVIAMLTLALVSGASLEEAAILANFAAGVEVGKQGTATVSIEELEEYMELVGGLA